MEDSPVLLVDHTIRTRRASALLSALESDFEDDSLVRTRTPEETESELPSARGLVTRSVTEETLEVARDLRWVQVLSAGTDHLDLDLLREHDVVLTNSSGIHAEPIAEQVLAYILAFERRLHRAYRQQSENRWERFDGEEARGKTVGIVGVGAIGTRVAEVCTALGMVSIGTKRNPDTAPAVLETCYPADDHHRVIERSDYLVLTCPLTPETEGLVGWNELRLLGDGVLINVARGAVVDESALTRALQQRRIRGAALDAFEVEPLPADSPLWSLSDVIITPHMAGSTPHKPERWREIILENYAAVAGDTDEFVNRIV